MKGFSFPTIYGFVVTSAMFFIRRNEGNDDNWIIRHEFEFERTHQQQQLRQHPNKRRLGSRGCPQMLKNFQFKDPNGLKIQVWGGVYGVFFQE